jgi:hypothetical protein
MICPKCGFDNPGGSFCGNCGESLGGPIVSISQSPRPRSKNKNLMIAVIAIVIVVVIVLAAVLVILPKDSSKSTPQAALNEYFDGTREHDANKVVDSTIFHFDSANRSLFILNLVNQWASDSTLNISIVSMEDISMSNVPSDIKYDVTNFTTAFQSLFSVTIQESQFVKVTVKLPNSTSNNSITYTLLSKIDGKWYFDIYFSYTLYDWIADRSMGDQGRIYFSSTPTGSFSNVVNNSGSWTFTIGSISPATLNYTDCEVQLTIGSHVSNAVAIPSIRYLVVPISAGSATGYEIYLIHFGPSGYLSAGDVITIGPITEASGRNAYQPTGTQVTLNLIYSPTGNIIATKTFTL